MSTAAELSHSLESLLWARLTHSLAHALFAKVFLLAPCLRVCVFSGLLLALDFV